MRIASSISSERPGEKLLTDSRRPDLPPDLSKIGEVGPLCSRVRVEKSPSEAEPGRVICLITAESSAFQPGQHALHHLRVRWLHEMVVEPGFCRAAAVFLLAPTRQCSQYHVLRAGRWRNRRATS